MGVMSGVSTPKAATDAEVSTAIPAMLVMPGDAARVGTFLLFYISDTFLYLCHLVPS